MDGFRAVLLLVVLICLTLASTASAAPGDLAAGFGHGGHVSGNPPSAIDEAALTGDGLIGLSFQQNGGGPLVLTRFLSSGARDRSFGESGGSVETGVRRVGGSALAVRPDGRALVAGTRFVYTAPSRYVFYVEQYGTDGRLDPAFGSFGRVELPVRADAANTLTAIEPLPDGRVLLGGRSESYAGSQLVLARLLPDGRLDRTFGREGVTALPLGARRFPDRPLDMMVRAGGAILAAGASSVQPLVRGGERAPQQPALVQFSSDGELDEEFGDGGVAAVLNPDDEGALIQVAPRGDGGIAALQVPANRFDSSPRGIAVRGFRPDGAVDRGFGHAGSVEIRLPATYTRNYWRLDARQLTAQPDGKLLVLASAIRCDDRGVGCDERIALGRLLATGRPDPEWGRDGRGLVIRRGPSASDGVYGGYSDADPHDLLLGPLGNPLVTGGASDGYLLSLFQDSVAPIPDRAVLATLPVDGEGAVQIPVGCQEAGPACVARVSLTAGGRRAGRGSVRFTPGATAVVEIRLSRRARSRVEDAGSLRTSVRLDLDDATGNTFSVRRRSTLVG